MLAVIGARRQEFAIGQLLDPESGFERRIAGNAGLAAVAEGDVAPGPAAWAAWPCRIDDEADGRVGGAMRTSARNMPVVSESRRRRDCPGYRR